MLALVINAILALQPALSYNYAEQFARPIVSVTNNLEDALILVVTINHESSFRRSVATCEITGDEGRAIGSTQLLWYHWGRFTKEQICTNPKIQFLLTINALGSGTAEEKWSRFTGRLPSNPKLYKEVIRRVETLEKVKKITTD